MVLILQYFLKRLLLGRAELMSCSLKTIDASTDLGMESHILAWPGTLYVEIMICG